MEVEVEIPDYLKYFEDENNGRSASKVSKIATMFQCPTENEDRDEKDGPGPATVVRTESHVARFNTARALFEKMAEKKEDPNKAARIFNQRRQFSPLQSSRSVTSSCGKAHSRSPSPPVFHSTHQSNGHHCSCKSNPSSVSTIASISYTSTTPTFYSTAQNSSIPSMMPFKTRSSSLDAEALKGKWNNTIPAAETSKSNYSEQIRSKMEYGKNQSDECLAKPQEINCSTNKAFHTLPTKIDDASREFNRKREQPSIKPVENKNKPALLSKPDKPAKPETLIDKPLSSHLQNQQIIQRHKNWFQSFSKVKSPVTSPQKHQQQQQHTLMCQPICNAHEQRRHSEDPSAIRHDWRRERSAILKGSGRSGHQEVEDDAGRGPPDITVGKNFENAPTLPSCWSPPQQYNESSPNKSDKSSSIYQDTPRPSSSSSSLSEEGKRYASKGERVVEGKTFIITDISKDSRVSNIDKKNVVAAQVDKANIIGVFKKESEFEKANVGGSLSSSLPREIENRKKDHHSEGESTAKSNVTYRHRADLSRDKEMRLKDWEKRLSQREGGFYGAHDVTGDRRFSAESFASKFEEKHMSEPNYDSSKNFRDSRECYHEDYLHKTYKMTEKDGKQNERSDKEAEPKSHSVFFENDRERKSLQIEKEKIAREERRIHETDKNIVYTEEQRKLRGKDGKDECKGFYERNSEKQSQHSGRECNESLDGIVTRKNTIDAVGKLEKLDQREKFKIDDEIREKLRKDEKERERLLKNEERDGFNKEEELKRLRTKEEESRKHKMERERIRREEDEHEKPKRQREDRERTRRESGEKERSVLEGDREKGNTEDKNDRSTREESDREKLRREKEWMRLKKDMEEKERIKREDKEHEKLKKSEEERDRCRKEMRESEKLKREEEERAKLRRKEKERMREEEEEQEKMKREEEEKRRLMREVEMERFMKEEEIRERLRREQEEEKLKREEEAKERLRKEQEMMLRRIEEERRKKEKEERLRREEEERLRKEEEENLNREKEEKFKREEEEKLKRKEEERRREEEERLRREEVERLRREEEERLRREEEERLMKEENERLRREEEERLRREEEEKLRRKEEERVRKIEEEKLRRIEEEKMRRMEEERLRRMEQERLRRMEQERLRRMELERLRKEEEEKIRKEEEEKIRKEEEEKLRKEEEERLRREEEERLRREEEERFRREEEERFRREEKERLRREEEERLWREEEERLWREEEERLMREEEERLRREEEERLRREEEERLRREEEERLRREEEEKLRKEEEERLRREKEERLRREEEERLNREEEERLRREKEENLKIQEEQKLRKEMEIHIREEQEREKIKKENEKLQRNAVTTERSISEQVEWTSSRVEGNKREGEFSKTVGVTVEAIPTDNEGNPPSTQDRSKIDGNKVINCHKDELERRWQLKREKLEEEERLRREKDRIEIEKTKKRIAELKRERDEIQRQQAIRLRMLMKKETVEDHDYDEIFTGDGNEGKDENFTQNWEENLNQENKIISTATPETSIAKNENNATTSMNEEKIEESEAIQVNMNYEEKTTTSTVVDENISEEVTYDHTVQSAQHKLEFCTGSYNESIPKDVHNSTTTNFEQCSSSTLSSNFEPLPPPVPPHNIDPAILTADHIIEQTPLPPLPVQPLEVPTEMPEPMTPEEAEKLLSHNIIETKKSLISEALEADSARDLNASEVSSAKSDHGKDCVIRPKNDDDDDGFDKDYDSVCVDSPTPDNEEGLDDSFSGIKHEVNDEGFVVRAKELLSEDGVHYLEDGHFWIQVPGLMEEDEDDIPDSVPFHKHTKLKFSQDPIKLYSTFSVTDYDRRNEEVDPVAASAEYELEKRVEKMNVFPVSINKGDGGLGLSIIGMGVGADAGVEKLGIFVKTITPDGATDRDGRIRVNDQIIEVDNQSLVGVTQMFAASVLKNTSGTVNFLVGRENDPENSEVAMLIRQSLMADQERDERRRALGGPNFDPREAGVFESFSSQSGGESPSEDGPRGSNFIRELQREPHIYGQEYGDQFGDVYNSCQSSSPRGTSSPPPEAFNHNVEGRELLLQNNEIMIMSQHLQEIQHRNEMYEEEINLLRNKISELERELGNVSELSKQAQEANARLNVAEDTLKSKQAEISTYQDMLEQSQGQYIILEKKYYKAKKIIKEYQNRERDFLHREEYHITQLEEKDALYNSLVKALKDRVIQLEGDLIKAQQEAGLPVKVPPDLNVQSSNFVLSSKGPDNHSSLQRDPPRKPSKLINCLDPDLSDTEAGDTHTSEGSKSSTVERKIPSKEELDVAVPPTELLDNSFSKAKGELASRGGLANRQLPSLKKSASNASSNSFDNSLDDGIDDVANESQQQSQATSPAIISTKSSVSIISHSENVVNISHSSASVSSFTTNSHSSSQEITHSSRSHPPPPYHTTNSQTPVHPTSPHHQPPPYQPPPSAPLSHRPVVASDSHSGRNDGNYRHPPPIARVQPVNRVEALPSPTSPSSQQQQQQTLANQLKALLAEREGGNEVSHDGNRDGSPLKKSPSSLMEDVRRAVMQADISIGKKPVISGPIHVSSTAQVVSTGQFVHSRTSPQRGVGTIPQKASRDSGTWSPVINTGTPTGGVVLLSQRPIDSSLPLSQSGELGAGLENKSGMVSSDSNTSFEAHQQHERVLSGRPHKESSIMSVFDWSKEQVAQWLVLQGLENYVATFVNAGITGPRLINIDTKDLKNLGLSSDDKNKIKRKVKELRQNLEKERKQIEKENKEREKLQKKAEKLAEKAERRKK